MIDGREKHWTSVAQQSELGSWNCGGLSLKEQRRYGRGCGGVFVVAA